MINDRKKQFVHVSFSDPPLISTNPETKNFRTTTFLLYILKKLHSRKFHIFFPTSNVIYYFASLQIVALPARQFLHKPCHFYLFHELKITAPSGITFIRSSLKIGQLAYIQKGRRFCMPLASTLTEKKKDVINWYSRRIDEYAWLQVSPAKLKKSALFWDITQRWVVIPYRRFRITYQSHIQGSRTARVSSKLMWAITEVTGNIIGWGGVGNCFNLLPYSHPVPFRSSYGIAWNWRSSWKADSHWLRKRAAN